MANRLFHASRRSQPCAGAVGAAIVFVWAIRRAGSMLRGFSEFVALPGRHDDHFQCRIGSWRTPSLVIGSGCLIAMIAFGPRSTLGFFLTPLSTAQSLGPRRLRLCARVAEFAVGHRPAARRHHRRPLRHHPGAMRRRAALCAPGLALMAHATSAPLLDASAGVLVGFGLAGCSFPVRAGGVRQDRAAGMALDAPSASAPRPVRSGNFSIRRSRSR